MGKEREGASFLWNVGLQGENWGKFFDSHECSIDGRGKVGNESIVKRERLGRCFVLEMST